MDSKVEHIRIVSEELLPPGVTDAEVEAKKHVIITNGFFHWSKAGQGKITGQLATILTFDPDCPRCKKLRQKRLKSVGLSMQGR